MQRRRKRARITPQARALIAHRALEHPRLRRAPLAEKLQTELRERGFDVPQFEVLERMISWYRNHAADNPQEKPWSMATLDHHPLPPCALPAVLRVWKSRVEADHHFTIREAKWTARLSAVEPNIEALSVLASCYTHEELMYELIDRPFDSTGLDRFLMAPSRTLPKISAGFLTSLARQAADVDGVRRKVDSWKAREKETE